MSTTKLTTIASTGLRMKMSVKCMRRPERSYRRRRRRSRLVIVGMRRERRARFHRVVDDDVRSIFQFERARGHDDLSGRDAIQDRNEIAACGTRAHELLPRGFERDAGVVRFVFDDE